MLCNTKPLKQWKPVSFSIKNPSSFSDCSGFPNTQYVVFTNDGTYRIFNVEAKAHVLCHGDLGDDMTVLSATARATIEVSNDNADWTLLKESNTVTADRVKDATASVSTFYSWDNGCPYKYIRCGTHGSAFKRYVEASLTGLKRGKLE